MKTDSCGDELISWLLLTSIQLVNHSVSMVKMVDCEFVESLAAFGPQLASLRLCGVVDGHNCENTIVWTMNSTGRQTFNKVCRVFLLPCYAVSWQQVVLSGTRQHQRNSPQLGAFLNICAGVFFTQYLFQAFWTSDENWPRDPEETH